MNADEVLSACALRFDGWRYREETKFDLTYEPQNGKFWRAFRTLFFEVCEMEPLEQYRDRRYYEQWEKHFKPRLQECIMVVRQAHDAIQYDDEARPRF